MFSSVFTTYSKETSQFPVLNAATVLTQNKKRAHVVHARAGLDGWMTL